MIVGFTILGSISKVNFYQTKIEKLSLLNYVFLKMSLFLSTNIAKNVYTLDILDTLQRVQIPIAIYRLIYIYVSSKTFS